MYKIQINQRVIEKIKNYTENYRVFFEEAYKDSWIWSEDTIIESYIKESDNRYFEIKNLLKEKLEQSIISYLHKTTIIKWRSKILLVSFSEKWNTKTITDIEIR